MAENEAEALNRDELRQLQLERFQSTLNRAYRNVPFHRNRQNRMAEETGKDPSLMEDIREISAFPFMSRCDLGVHYPYGLFAVPLRDIVRIHTAPGATLHPTVTGFTRQDLGMWRTVVARSLSATGISSHDILQIHLDPGLANWGRDYKDGAEAMEVSVIPNTPLSPEKQLMVLKDYKTTALVTTPSEASRLAGHIAESDINPTALNLKRVILSGEPPVPEIRESLASQLHVETWLHFGLSEVPGPAIAFECEAHEGLHVNEDHFYPEIIDPGTGETLPAGTPGELVLTTLTTRAFPLIRFRTGEGARLIEEPCICGRVLKRMEWLGNRTDDILNVNGVKVHQNQIQEIVSRILGFSPRYRHALSRSNGGKKILEIRVQMEKRLFSDEIKFIEGKINILTRNLREGLGVPVRIRMTDGTNP